MHESNSDQPIESNPQEIIHHALQRKAELETKLQELNESIGQLQAQKVIPQHLSEEHQSPLSPLPAKTDPPTPVKHDTQDTLDQTQKKQELIEAIEQLVPRVKPAVRSSSEATLKSAPAERNSTSVSLLTRPIAFRGTRGFSAEKPNYLPKRPGVVKDLYEKDFEERRIRAARVKEYSQFVRSQYSPKRVRTRGQVPQPKLPKLNVQVFNSMSKPYRFRPRPPQLPQVPTVVFDYLKELENLVKTRGGQSTFHTEPRADEPNTPTEFNQE